MPPIDVIVGLLIVSIFGFFFGCYSAMGYYVGHDHYPVRKLSNGKILSGGLLAMYIFDCAVLILVGFLMIYGLGDISAF